MNVEVRENIMATIVDMLSMMFAYSLGLHNAGFAFGVFYAGFDAWLVIWQRNRITRWMAKICARFDGSYLSYRKPGTLYVGKMVWDKV